MLGGGELGSFSQVGNLSLRGIAGRSHFFVERMNVAVLAIDARDRSMTETRSFESQRDCLGVAGLLGRSIVPDCDDERAVLLARNQGSIGIQSEALVAELMQNFEGGEGGLGNPIFGEQAETAVVKRLLHHALFFEHVGETSSSDMISTRPSH